MGSSDVEILKALERDLDSHYGSDEWTLVDDLIKSSIPPPPPPPSKKRKTTTQTPGAIGRHVRWNPHPNYALVREGSEVIQDETHIQTLHRDGALTMEHMCLFKHRDVHLERNAQIPVYEAAYWCAALGYYVLVQKRHFVGIYNVSKRRDRTRKWDILDGGDPYWVDRHLFRVLAQEASKRAYDSKSSIGSSSSSLSDASSR